MDPSCSWLRCFLNSKAGRWIRRLRERGRPQQLAKSESEERSLDLSMAEWCNFWLARTLCCLTSVVSKERLLPELKHISRGRKRKQKRRPE